MIQTIPVTFTLMCTPGGQYCITWTKCCCSPQQLFSGLPITVTKASDGTKIASGTTNGAGKFCFTPPCPGVPYNVTWPDQDGCGGGTSQLQDNYICASQDYTWGTSPDKKHECCQNVNLPFPLYITDSNGTWGASLGGGASASGVLAHGNDTWQPTIIGASLNVTVDSAWLCLINVFTQPPDPCWQATEFYGYVYSDLSTYGSWLVSYGYGLECGTDARGTYLICTVGWYYWYAAVRTGHAGGTDRSCCYGPGGCIVCGPIDCKSLPQFETLTWTMGDLGHCNVTDPVPFPVDPHYKTVTAYGGGAPSNVGGRGSSSSKQYIGDGTCIKADGPWTFDFAPGTTGWPSFQPVTWGFEGPDQHFDYIGDSRLRPPPPGGTTVIVSG